MRNLAAFTKWYPSVRDCLAPNSENLLRVDDDAKAINLYPGRREFFDRAIVDLGRPGREAERARRMLNRYVPEGPGPDAMGQAWADWWKANADYLFFGEAGGYRWYLDPLAKARRVPTGQLRGPAGPAVSRKNDDNSSIR